MNRIIKFRAWHKRKKKMSLPFEPFIEKNFQVTFIVKNPKQAGDWVNDKFSNMNLMQYTGIKDKNGVEIYEDDLVVHPSTEQVYCVYYMDVAFKLMGTDKKRDGNNFGKSYAPGVEKIDEAWDIDAQEGYNTDFEVIGNIHQNPEYEEN